jgi:hypothetical protein
MALRIVDKKRLPCQDRLLRCTAREILADGPFSCGKTQGMVMDVMEKGRIYPGLPAVLLRKYSVELENTLMKTFKVTLFGDQARDWEMEEVADRHPWFSHWDAGERKMVWHNRTSIQFGYLSKSSGKVATSKLGTSYGYIGSSQAEQFDEADLGTLRGRMRWNGGLNRMVSECNPDSFTHPLYLQYFPEDSRHDRGKPVLNSARVQFNLMDNLPNLPKGYLEQQMANPDKSFVKRYILGEWGVIYEGAVYGIFVPDYWPTGNLIPRPSEEERLRDYWRFMGMLDWGYKHNAAFNIWGKEYEGYTDKFEAEVKDGLTMDDMIALWGPHVVRYKPAVIYVPHDRPDLAEDMRRKTRKTYGKAWPLNGVETGPGLPSTRITWMQNGYKNRTQRWCDDLPRIWLEAYRYLDTIHKENTNEVDEMKADEIGVYEDRGIITPPSRQSQKDEEARAATARALGQAGGIQRMLLERRENRGRRKVEVGV